MPPNGTAAQGNTVPERERASNPGIGELTKIGAASAALAYGIGMLTINTYLHKLGISDFSLAKPKLILTGVLVILGFSLLGLLPIFVARRLADDGRPKRRNSRILWVLLFLPLLFLFGASLYYCSEKPGLGQLTVWEIHRHFTGIGPHPAVLLRSLTVTAEVYFPVCVAAVFACLAARLLHEHKTQHDSELSPERISALVLVALAVVSVFGYMVVFSRTFYAAIPSAFGGGEPRIVNRMSHSPYRCCMNPIIRSPFGWRLPMMKVTRPKWKGSDSRS